LGLLQGRSVSIVNRADGASALLCALTSASLLSGRSVNRDGLFHAPKLKATHSDRALDSNSGKPVRRSSGSFDDAFRMPRRKLGGQLAALRIAGKGAETVVRFGLENIDPHCLRLYLLAAGRPRSAGFGLPLASRPGFLRGAAIEPSKIAFLRASLRDRRTASLFSRADCSDGFS